MVNYNAENAPYGYFLLNNDGLIMDANLTLLNWMGYEYDELVNTNIEASLSIASKMMFHSIFFLQLQLNGRVDEVNLTVKAKNGLNIPIMLMGYRESCGDEDIINCIAVKMTKRYDYEKELRDIKLELEKAYKSKNDALEKENELRILLEATLFSIAEGIIVTDLTGKITLMNPLAEKLTAWSIQDAYGKDTEDIFKLIQIDTREQIQNHVKEVLENGITLETSNGVILLSKDGSEHFISETTSAIFSDDHEIKGVVIAFRDITIQYLQEKEIDGFLNVNLDMLCVSDLYANFHKVNKKFEEVLGYSTVELVGQNYLSFIHQEDINSTLEAIKDLANNKKVSAFINRYRCKDGSYKYIEWQAQLGVGDFTYSSARDVTEKKKQEEERLKNSEDKYRFVAENVLDVVWIMNLSKDNYTYISPSILHQTGYTVEESMMQRMEDIFTPESILVMREILAKAKKYLEKHPTSPYKKVTEMQKLCKNGEIIWVELTTNIFYNPQGDIEIVGTSRNIQERKQIEKLRHLSYHDQLTGIYNRQFFNSIIDDEMARSDNYEQKLSMCIIDLDHFKNVNDTWGHPIGDELLKLTAETALKNKRNSDLLFRFGGEEFVILMPGTNISDAILPLEKIREKIENINHPVTGKQTVSMGVAERLKHESFFDWYKRADDALYRAKHEGRNRIVAST